MTSTNLPNRPKTNQKTDAQRHQDNRPLATDPIQMEIVFGRPSKECQDLGICRINLITDLPNDALRDCTCINHVWVHQNQMGQLHFRFPKNQMNPENLNTQFVDNYFTVQESYIFPEPLRQLFFPRTVIERGRYPVVEGADNLLIVL
ncbi:MAG: hypothetical protein AAF960_04580 [Bacteroidota bacterium]